MIIDIPLAIHTAAHCVHQPHCSQATTGSAVYLLDDSFNMREYVARVLMMVCEVSESDAATIMKQADWEGGALIGTWEMELACHHYTGLTRAGLRASLRPLD